jgi:hypothetical protein
MPVSRATRGILVNEMQNGFRRVLGELKDESPAITVKVVCIPG